MKDFVAQDKLNSIKHSEKLNIDFSTCSTLLELFFFFLISISKDRHSTYWTNLYVDFYAVNDIMG